MYDHRNYHRILLVAHCILNPCSVIHGRTNNEALAQKTINLALNNKTAVIQMPCPEFTICGAKRWAQSYEQYDTPWFHNHCRALAEPLVDQLKDYQNDKVPLAAIVGIKGSPSCSASTVSSADYKGLVPQMSEDVSLPPSSTVNMNGHFIKILTKLLKENSIDCLVTDLPKKNCTDKERDNFIELLTESFLSI